MISETVSHYRITEKLSTGGIGETYKAYDTTLKRSIALKLLPAELMQNEDRLRGFIQEAKAASSLNHPNIITIHEIGQVNSTPVETAKRARDLKPSEYETENEDTSLITYASIIYYIAMEFMEGETLTAKIHQNRMGRRKLLEYLLQVAEGLTKAHQSGIIHRYLKPDSIIITEDGCAKILDFGLAKLMEPQQMSSGDNAEVATALMGEAKPCVMMGAVGYMSPEQARGVHADHRSDIFSFGCILYEVITGNQPFQSDSVIDSLHKIIYTKPISAREFNPACPYALLRIIRRCLAKDPEDRYQRMKDLALDLREMLEEYRTESSFTDSLGSAQDEQWPVLLDLDAEAADLEFDEADPEVKQLATFSKASVALIVLSVLSAIIFWFVYGKAEIGSDLKLAYSKEAVLLRGREIAKNLGYDVDGMKSSVIFTQSNFDLKHVSATGGVAEARRAVQGGKVAVWKMRFTASGGQPSRPGELSISINPQGDLVNFSTLPRDGIEVETLDKGQAMELAKGLARRWLLIDPNDYGEEEYVQRASPHGVIQITWRNPNSVFGHKERTQVSLQGTRVTTLSRTFEPTVQPGSYEPWFADAIRTIRNIIIGFTVGAIYLFGVIFLIHKKRWHAFGRSLPRVLTVLMAVGVFSMFFAWPDQSIEGYVMAAVLTLIIGIALLPSCAGLLEWLRRSSPLRLFGAEQMAKRRLFSPSAAASLVHGVFGGVLIAGIICILKAMTMEIPGYLPSMSNETDIISRDWLIPISLGIAGISVLYVLIVGVIVELTERIVHNPIAAQIASALIFASATSPDYDQPELLAIIIAFLSSFLIMFVVVHIYSNRGLAALWVAFISWSLLEIAARGRFIEAPGFVLQSNLLLLSIAALLALGIWGYAHEAHKEKFRPRHQVKQEA